MEAFKAVAQLEEDWRNKLDVIWLRYEIDRSPDTKEEYRRLLKQVLDQHQAVRRPALAA